MKKASKWIKALVGVLCVLVLAGVVMLALYLDSLLPDPIFGVFRPDPAPEEDVTTSTTVPNDEEQEDEEAVPPPEDLPPTVEIPVVTDPETGETGISFPCEVPGYGLTIHRLAPYSGMYVEDGTNANVTNVAMLLVSNHSDYPIEYASIAVQYGDETLTFDISALPKGEKMVVQEKTGKAVPDGKAQQAQALVVRRANMEMSRDQVEVVDNGDNTLTIRNLSGKLIPTVRVFYKYYMKDEDVFVGGIAFTVRVTNLGADSSVTIQPSHYSSETGRVVMVLTYDTEV